MQIDLQIACESATALPTPAQLQDWLAPVLKERGDTELTIRIVEAAESAELNGQYRGKHKPTNVLSFPAELPEHIELPLLGDLVICAEVVAHEAEEQKKLHQAHWAHMVIHGCLHLLGYDHIDDNDAKLMEAREIELLAALGYPNPYELAGDEHSKP